MDIKYIYNKLIMNMKSIDWYKSEYGKKWLKVYNKDKKRKLDRLIKPVYGKHKNKHRCWYNEFDEYREECRLLTNVNYKSLPNSHRRSFTDMHVDHKISIRYGYDNGIPIEHISHESNLRMIYHSDNKKKGRKILVDEDNKWILIENEIPFTTPDCK